MYTLVRGGRKMIIFRYSSGDEVDVRQVERVLLWGI